MISDRATAGSQARIKAPRAASFLAAGLALTSLLSCGSGAEAADTGGGRNVVGSVSVSNEIMELVDKLEPTAAHQAQLLSDGVVTRADVEDAIRRTIACGEGAGEQLGLEVVFHESIDQAGLLTYTAETKSPPDVTREEDDLLLTAWDVAHQRCQANEKSLVMATFTGASPFDDRGVNQLEASLVDAGAIRHP